jgi:hypothetical protein
MFRGVFLWHTGCGRRTTAMNIKFAWLITPLLLAYIHLAEAQQPKKIPHIGYLTVQSQASSASGSNIEAFRQVYEISATLRERT